jgi:hypothetical protein
VKTTRHSITRALLTTLLAVTIITHAEAKPWWWFGKTPVKTAQYALPSNNGGMASVTIPASSLKTASVKNSTNRRQTRDSAANRIDDERIAADLERHF